MEELKPGIYSGNVLLSRGNQGIVASITGYHADNFNGAIHYHNNAHFSFALNGGCVEKKKDPYEITPGFITYYSAGEVHQVIKVPKPTRRVNLEIEPWFFEYHGISDNAARLAVTQNPDAKFLMVKISRELLVGDGLSETTVRMLLLQLVADTQKQGYDGGVPAWVGTVREFLQGHSDETITLDNLSGISGLHPVTISKLFPKYFSCTVGEFKRKLKIEKALSIIKTSPASLTDIAYDCGFFDQSHFIRTFKQLTGCLPSAYQKL